MEATRPDLAGKTVRIKDHVTHFQQPNFGGSEFIVEGYWDDVTGGSWMFANGNPACMVYAIRGIDNKIPTDDNVLYGKVGNLGHLVHISEVEYE